jgi:hypothetical protein
MSKISLAPDASGTGIFTIASPGTSTNRTLTLPDDTGTLALTGSRLTGTTDSGTPFETALGTDAGAVNTGVNNVFVGFEAGKANTTGDEQYCGGFSVRWMRILLVCKIQQLVLMLWGQILPEI